MICGECGGWMRIGDFPFCHGDAAKHQPVKSFTVIGDDIPGGMEIANGLCNPDGSPRRYYTKSEIAREAKARGYHNHVEHVTAKGTDKSPHTTRWI
jgi:hypothetical protein